MPRLTPRHQAGARAPRGRTPAEEFSHYLSGEEPLLEDAHVGLYVYLEYLLKTHEVLDVPWIVEQLKLPAEELFVLLKRLEAVELLSVEGGGGLASTPYFKTFPRSIVVRLLPRLGVEELEAKRRTFLRRVKARKRGR